MVSLASPLYKIIEKQHYKEKTTWRVSADVCLVTRKLLRLTATAKKLLRAIAAGKPARREDQSANSSNYRKNAEVD